LQLISNNFDGRIAACHLFWLVIQLIYQDKFLVVSIEDNGKGLESAKSDNTTMGIGLKNIIQGQSISELVWKSVLTKMACLFISSLPMILTSTIRFLLVDDYHLFSDRLRQ
jgi:hypothetical protein